MKAIFKQHNAIDINGTTPVIFTPFYQWLWLQYRGGYEYTSLPAALSHYLGLQLGKEFIKVYPHDCYRHIMDYFSREVGIQYGPH